MFVLARVARAFHVTKQHKEKKRINNPKIKIKIKNLN